MNTKKVMLVGGPGAGRVVEMDNNQGAIFVAEPPKFGFSKMSGPDSWEQPRDYCYIVRKWANQPNATGGPVFHYLATHDDRDMMAELIEVYGATKRIEARERWAGRVEGLEWALKVMQMEGATDTPAYARMLTAFGNLKREAKCE